MVISRRPLRFIFVAIIACFSFISYANPVSDSTKVHTEATTEVSDSLKRTVNTNEASHEEITHKAESLTGEEERSEYIQHHLKDSHDFTLFAYGKESGHEKYFGFPLPVIIWADGLHVFSSSRFEHETKVVESNGKYFKIEHGILFECDADGNIDHHAHTNPLRRPLDLSITKNIFMMILTGLLMLFIFSGLAKSYKKNNGVPKGIGRFFEPLVIYVKEEIAIPNIGQKAYGKYMPFLLTVFFFIWFLNMFGLTPLGVNVTGNIAVTAALAILVYLITTFTANKNYWGHIFWMPGVPTPMKLILAPIELLGTLIKPFSLTIRLFANMMAGHVVVMTIIALMYTFNHPVGSPLSFLLAFVLSLLEILVAFLQAYIFTMLAALYFGSANEEHHHDDAHH